MHSSWPTNAHNRHIRESIFMVDNCLHECRIPPLSIVIVGMVLGWCNNWDVAMRHGLFRFNHRTSANSYNSLHIDFPRPGPDTHISTQHLTVQLNIDGSGWERIMQHYQPHDFQTLQSWDCGSLAVYPGGNSKPYVHAYYIGSISALDVDLFYWSFA